MWLCIEMAGLLPLTNRSLLIHVSPPNIRVKTLAPDKHIVFTTLTSLFTHNDKLLSFVTKSQIDQYHRDGTCSLRQYKWVKVSPLSFRGWSIYVTEE